MRFSAISLRFYLYYFCNHTIRKCRYGDVVPRSLVGRFLTIIWMILGLAAASLMTAAVSDVVLGVDYIDLGAYKVSLKKNNIPPS